MTTTAAHRIAEKQHALRPEEIQTFHEQGYLGPLTAIDPEEMSAITQHFAEILKQDRLPGNGEGPQHNRYLDDVQVFRIASHPAIVDRVASLIGDALLWRSTFFCKNSGGCEIPWHQDYAYWPIEPAVVVSAWLACDPVDRENSCVNLLPGTHRKLLEHEPVDDKSISFRQKAKLEGVDLQDAVPMEMKAGQFFLFTERMLHQSDPNCSQRRRIGLVMRYIHPLCRVLEYNKNGPQPHTLRLVAGQDRMGFNRRSA